MNRTSRRHLMSAVPGIVVATLVTTNTARAQTPVASPLPGSYHPTIDPANFVPVVDNPYFPLVPGTTFVFQGNTGDAAIHNEVSVSHDTRRILGIVCTVVHDIVYADGELSEDTLDWYAQDTDGNVWYLGEDARAYETGQPTSTEGSWEAGVDGAQPGIIMQANPVPGDPYRQEYSPGIAEDMGQVIATGQTATVPIGAYHDVLITHDWDAREPDVVEEKAYAPGIGTISTDSPAENEHLELVSITVEPIPGATPKG